MTKLPRVTGKKVVAALGKAGFETVRTKGSHFYLRHPDGRATVVPVHSGETLGPGLLAQILRDCELSAENLRSLL